MIRKNLDDMPCLGEVMSVLREGVDDSVEFFVMNVPILLRGVKLVMKEEKGMPSIVVLLFEDASIGFVRGVGGEADRSAGLECADIDIVTDVG